MQSPPATISDTGHESHDQDYEQETARMRTNNAIDLRGRRRKRRSRMGKKRRRRKGRE